MQDSAKKLKKYHGYIYNLQKNKKIKILILDLDGVLSTGQIFWIKDSGWSRLYSVQDGYGLKILSKLGIDLAIISGASSKDVEERAKSLGIKHLYLGLEEKLIPYEDLKKSLNYKDEEVAYIGDEIFDIPLLKKVGFSATVPHAVEEVKKVVHYITKKPGGRGAVREVADIIRYAYNSKDFNSFEALFREHYKY